MRRWQSSTWLILQLKLTLSSIASHRLYPMDIKGTMQQLCSWRIRCIVHWYWWAFNDLEEWRVWREHQLHQQAPAIGATWSPLLWRRWKHWMMWTSYLSLAHVLFVLDAMDGTLWLRDTSEDDTFKYIDKRTMTLGQKVWVMMVVSLLLINTLRISSFDMSVSTLLIHQLPFLCTLWDAHCTRQLAVSNIDTTMATNLVDLKRHCETCATTMISYVDNNNDGFRWLINTSPRIPFICIIIAVGSAVGVYNNMSRRIIWVISCQKKMRTIDTNWAAQQQAHQTHIVMGFFLVSWLLIIDNGIVFLGIWVKRRKFIIPY